jgi:cobalt-zinc-cadmium efflux system outer membrane protein
MLLLFAPIPGWAQPLSLTEGDALRRALARPELADLDRGAVDAAEAEVIAAGILPNPSLSYSRDRTRGGPGSAEETTWQLAQSFDVSGRRALRRDAAERRVAAAASGNTARRTDIAAEVRRRFYESLRRQEEVRATGLWVQRFARVETIVQRLARAGEASGYDQRRLSRERQTAQAKLSAEQADLERSLERLAAIVGEPGKISLRAEGSLLPVLPPPVAVALAQLDQRSDLLALSRRAEAAELEGKAAARGWIPDVTIGIGPKRVENNTGTEHGTLLTFSIPLPVFDRQQPGARHAAAAALSARAEYRIERSRAEGELRGLHRQVVRLIDAAAEFRARAVSVSPELLRIAEAAYQGGESTLLELLDAFRSALDAETTVLDLEWKARAARIEYDLVNGSIPQ